MIGARDEIHVQMGTRNELRGLSKCARKLQEMHGMVQIILNETCRELCKIHIFTVLRIAGETYTLRCIGSHKLNS